MNISTVIDSAPSSEEASNPTKYSIARRHDLDALRAIAMLLGIVLHAALSFAPIPWTVQDTQQSEFYYILFSFIHGFRMPLFFVVSGFFTAMLWRKRGLASLLKHRFMRIFLPMVLGCVTIVPAVWFVGYLASRPIANNSEGSNLFSAVVGGDVDLVQSELQKPDIDVDAIDGNSGSTSLNTAVFVGHTEVVRLLIEAGADVNKRNRDNATPLHIAAFMGRAAEAEMLLSAGADTNSRDGSGNTPHQNLNIDIGTTNFIANSLGVPLEEETLVAGRKKIAVLLGETSYVNSDRNSEQAAALAGLYGLFFLLPVFMHLWFLWFLCWLVVAFLLYSVIANAIKIEKLPKWIVCSPFSLCWLVPLTMIPQAFMQPGVFGPDSSVGLMPIPRVLIYYAIFFFFGSIYWDMNDHQGRLGRWWTISLPLAVFVVFPIGLDFTSGTFGVLTRFHSEAINQNISNGLQVLFAWLMTFGSIGACRNLLSRESRTLRYISDSSYWLYLAHLPLVILAQWFVRAWPIPSAIKFAGIVIIISTCLLITYQIGVRYTFIGYLLNGPRKRSQEQPT